jgi:hypothetical protein
MIDPLVLDRYRRTKTDGGRTLTNLARHYGVEQGTAHDALGDVETTQRLVDAIASRYPQIAAMNLDELHAYQQRAHASWADHMNVHLAGEPGERIPIDPALAARAAPADERGRLGCHRSSARPHLQPAGTPAPAVGAAPRHLPRPAATRHRCLTFEGATHARARSDPVSEDRTLARIAPLLRQAEGTSNEHEADAFMQAAQRLATAHSIDLAIARAHTAKREGREEPVIKRIDIGPPGRRGLRTYAELFLACGRPNDVAFDIAHNSTYVIAYGLPSDIAVTETLYASLAVQMVRASDT